MLVKSLLSDNRQQKLEAQYFIGNHGSFLNDFEGTKAFCRNVCTSTISFCMELARGLCGLTSLKDRAVQLTSFTSQYMKSSMSLVIKAWDKVNPVSIIIRNGPRPISTPLQFMRDEANGLMEYLCHPANATSGIVHYFSSKPSRLAKLFRACGVAIPETVLEEMKLNEDWDKAKHTFPAMIKKGINAEKIFDTEMSRVRGKLILSAIKAMLDGGVDFENEVERLISKMFVIVGKRIGAKIIEKETEEGCRLWLSRSSRPSD